MKVKKLLLSLIFFVIVFVIYVINSNNQIHYLSIGDSLINGYNSYGGRVYGFNNYVEDYLNNNQIKSTFLIDNSKNDVYKNLINLKDNGYINIKKSKKYLKSELTKSNLVVLSLGHDEIYNAIKNNNNVDLTIDVTIENIDYYLKEVKKYAKENIVLIGFYDPFRKENTKKIISNINKNLKIITKSNKICYLNIDELNDEKYFINKNGIFPDQKGYEYISLKIINIIEEQLKNNSCQKVK